MKKIVLPDSTMMLALAATNRHEEPLAASSMGEEVAAQQREQRQQVEQEKEGVQLFATFEEEGGHSPQHRRNDNHNKYDPDYHVQMARVVKTLLEELPSIIDQGISYDIFAPNVRLAVGGRCTKGGLYGYKFVTFAFRHFARCLLQDDRAVKVWRVQKEQKDAVIIRWCLSGTIRCLGPFEIEGTFIYELNERGLVNCHAIDLTAHSGLPKIFAIFQSPCPQC